MSFLGITQTQLLLSLPLTLEEGEEFGSEAVEASSSSSSSFAKYPKSIMWEEGGSRFPGNRERFLRKMGRRKEEKKKAANGTSVA